MTDRNLTRLRSVSDAWREAPAKGVIKGMPWLQEKERERHEAARLKAMQDRWLEAEIAAAEKRQKARQTSQPEDLDAGWRAGLAHINRKPRRHNPRGPSLWHSLFGD